MGPCEDEGMVLLTFHVLEDPRRSLLDPVLCNNPEFSKLSIELVSHTEAPEHEKLRGIFFVRDRMFYQIRPSVVYCFV